MRAALLLCLLSLTVGSQGRRERRDLLVAADGEDSVSHLASPSDLVAAADTSGSRSRQSPSSANSPPNSWLYKFPPWFLPGNPAPEGFHSLPGKSQAAAKEFSMVDDGDVLIIENFGSRDRTGRLGNVRVPGNSAFRDEIVQTVLNVKYGRSQSAGTRVASSQVVTPWLLAQSAPEPPRSSPTPTVPITLQQSHGGDAGFDNNLVTGRQQRKHEALPSSLPLGNNPPVISNGEDFLSKIVRTDSLASDAQNIKFQPSPPDAYQASRPLSAAQGGQSSAVVRGFRPSKLLSVTFGGQDPLQQSSVGGVTLTAATPPVQQHSSRNNIQHNNLNNNSFLKARQAALLKASDRPQSLRYQNLGDDGRSPQSTAGLTKERVVPFLPGIPLPFLLQYSHQLAQIGRRPSPQATVRPQRHQRSGRENLPAVANDLRQQRQGSGSAPLPTSIQDIINGDYDTAQAPYPTGRDFGVSVTGDLKQTEAGGRDGDKQWLWGAS